MDIDVWSDIACPFCYLGKRQLEKALEQFDHADKVKVKYHSFQLDPSADIDNTQTMYEMLASKYGRPADVMRESNKQTFANAEQFDIKFNFDDVKLTNTFDAHRLIHFANTVGKQSEMKTLLFKSYFTDGLNIGHQDVLISIAQQAQLNVEEVTEMLKGDQFAFDVKQDIEKAKDLGITGVPMFVFDMKYAVSGAQGVEAILAALNEAFENH